MDIDAYLVRIGLSRPQHPNLAALTALQRAHRRAIPFENLDIPLGRGISLDPRAVFAKLVTAGRGGYCFEQNGLFLAALLALGFTARPLLARVWLMATGVPPRTHTLSLVTLDGQEWLADAGFGGSDVPPMRLEDGAVTEVGSVRYLLRRDREFGWMLERDGADQYSFTEERVFPADLEMANHWVATAPASRFVLNRIVSIVSSDGLTSLTGARLSADGNTTELAGTAAYRAVLAERFGIVLDEGEVETLLAG